MPSFVHSLSIERPYGVDGIDVDSDTDLDEYGQPTRSFTELAAVPGLIQPKTAREIALASQAGAAIGNHTIFLGRQDLTTADRIRDVTEDQAGPVYQVIGVRDFNFGGLPHLEVDAVRIASADVAVGS
jgi:head-tail adaptor